MSGYSGPLPSGFDDDEPLLSRRGKGHHEATFDITAMIDLVFMLNIFFLVTTVAAVSAELDLPVIRHCIPTDTEDAVMISVIAPDPKNVIVQIGDNPKAEQWTEHDEQTRAIHQAAEEAARAGKHVVLIRAERSVKLRDIQRISAAATRDIPGLELRMAVIEKE